MAAVEADDNVVVLGSADLRLIPWIAPRCRQLLVVDDLPDEELARLEREQHAGGLTNVRFQWGRSNVIPTPQYTTDRVISLNYVYRSRHPFLVVRQMHTTSRPRVVLNRPACEPSSSLDSRTARKYSAKPGCRCRITARWWRTRARPAPTAGSPRDGLRDLLGKAGVQEIAVRELPARPGDRGEGDRAPVDAGPGRDSALRVTPGEDAGDVVEDVGGADFAVPVVLRQADFHDVDLLLRVPCRRTLETRLVSLIESFWSSKSLSSRALCRRSFVR